jgi:hypothetical protein
MILLGLYPLLLAQSHAFGQYPQIYEGPAFNADKGEGYSYGGFWQSSGLGNTEGAGFANLVKYSAGLSLGDRAMRWNQTGAIELGHLGTNGEGRTEVVAMGVNDAGTVAGFALKHVDGVNLGWRPVRWDAGTTIATDLGPPGTEGFIWAMSADGTSVGSSDAGTGSRAARWDPGSTALTRLDDGAPANAAHFSQA